MLYRALNVSILSNKEEKMVVYIVLWQTLYRALYIMFDHYGQYGCNLCFSSVISERHTEPSPGEISDFFEEKSSYIFTVGQTFLRGCCE